VDVKNKIRPQYSRIGLWLRPYFSRCVDYHSTNPRNAVCVGQENVDSTTTDGELKRQSAVVISIDKGDRRLVPSLSFCLATAVAGSHRCRA